MMNAVIPDTNAPTAISDRLDVAALWYLALPNLIFLGSYLKPGFGIPATLLMIAVLAYTSRGGLRNRIGVGPAAWLVVGAISVIWLLVSGVGHFVYANPDWTVRDIVLHDLATRPWPVEYNVVGNPVPVLLRAPLGYFLPAALLARLFGSSLAIGFLFVWTLIGVLISLLLIVSRQKKLGGIAIVIIVFVFFSGMDIVGQVWLDDSVTLGQHIEWWARYFQYSSITTQLFWVPNHALPGWIVAGWMMRRMDTGTFTVRWAVLMVAMTPLWSPLAAIGLGFMTTIVLVARVLFREGGGAPTLPRRVLELLDPVMLIGGVIVLGLIAPFLLIASETVPGGALGGGWQGMWLLAPRVFAFVMIEFGIFWILMLKRYRTDLLLTTSGVLLLILPWLRFGPNSDLTMRASIPALVVFAVRLGDWFTERLLPEQGKPIKEDALASLAMVVFVIGMATPFQEIIRAFIQPAEAVDTSVSMYGATNGGATHYLAPRAGAFADSLLANGDDSSTTPKEVHIAPPVLKVPDVLKNSIPASSGAVVSSGASVAGPVPRSAAVSSSAASIVRKRSP